MMTGVLITPNRRSANPVDDAVKTAMAAQESGVRSVWLGQQLDYDAITLASVIGSAVPGVSVGTSVVPLNPRHPLIIAAAAQTAQAATHGIPPFPVYVAAMAPRSLQIAGELADGTLTSLAGPRTIERFIRPSIAQAAADARRPTPRIIAAVPVAVTDDADAARASAARTLGVFDSVPSYQRVIAREGLSNAADLSLMGTATAVTHQIGAYISASATELLLLPIQTAAADQRRVWDVAAAF
jgi:alkanesulfonate monooxygenase SsuD/methylene tetrahydromethanopterin reductase-like flavin-dependent oxidoreductase (luciferase family)